MTTIIEDFIVDLYDAHVSAAGSDAVKSCQVREAMREDVRVKLARMDRDLDREADLLIRKTIASTREQRARSIKKDLEEHLSGFAEGDSEAWRDPMLDLAFPLGDSAGTDKSLRYWTEQDFQNLVITRYRVAGEVTAAASALDQTVKLVLERYRLTGAATFEGALGKDA